MVWYLVAIYSVVALVLTFLHGYKFGDQSKEDRTFLGYLIVFWPISLVVLAIVSPFIEAHILGVYLKHLKDRRESSKPNS